MIAIEEAVVPVVLEIVKRKDSSRSDLHLDDKLVGDLGLRSLDLAEIVAVLEQKTGLDPFAELVSITSVRTVRDICNAYETAAAPDAYAGDAELEAIRARAAERR